MDARKVFDLYWSIDDGLKSLPKAYDSKLSTTINSSHPLKVFNVKDNTMYKVFIGSSPKSLSADGRTDDLEAILHVIKSAQKYIYIAINEYIPMDLWKNQQPWTPIDDELRKAVTQRNIEVKFLVNGRASHKELMLKHLRNLMEVAPLSIQIKIYQVRDKSAG